MTIVYGFDIMNGWAVSDMAMPGRGVWKALFAHSASEREHMSGDGVCGKGAFECMSEDDMCEKDAFEHMSEDDVSGRRRYRYGK